MLSRIFLPFIALLSVPVWLVLSDNARPPVAEIHDGIALRLWWLLTETASLPFALGSTLLLSLLLLCARHRDLHPLRLLLLTLALLLLTQAEKSLLKHYFALPRPYIELTAEHHRLTVPAFYAADRATQEQWVRDWHHAHSSAPDYLVRHRVKEIAYRFPSGHTIFVASWLFLFSFYCRYRALTAAVFLWAAVVMISRVRLGVHLPADLAASVFLAAGSALCLHTLTRKRLSQGGARKL